MDSKIYRQKEMHLFVYDYNGYYSSLTHKYIKLVFNSNNITEDEDILKFGLYIALHTKSIFIFPQFKCEHCSGYCKYCGNHTFCSFIEFWRIREMNKYYKDIYRESVYIYFLIILIDFFITSYYTIYCKKDKKEYSSEGL